jgi:sec-independent protein translocase protein TatC
VLNKVNRWLQDSIFKPLEDKKMPVMEHLVEFQVRLTRAVIVLTVIFMGTFFYADTLVKWLRVPLQNMFVPRALSWEPTDLPRGAVCLSRPGGGAVAERQSGRALCCRGGHALSAV